MNIKKLNAKFANCTCKKEHKCDIQSVVIEENALTKVAKLVRGYKKVLVVYDKNTYQFAKVVIENLGKKFENQILLVGQGELVIPNEEQIEVISNMVTNKTDLIIGVGSGVINDLCKYVSFTKNLPYYIVATAPSMDGYASVGSALILKGMKVTINARPPKAIIGDTLVLKDAPIDMLRAGYGDIVGKFSCLNDWLLSNVINGEHLCQEIYNLVMKQTKKISKLASKILDRDILSVKTLMEALVIVGVCMSYVNSSRPASGSEHHLSHYFEITGILRNKDYFSHGIDVIYSAYVTQKVRETLLKIENPTSFTNLSKEEYLAKITPIYKGLTEEVFALQEKVGFYNKYTLNDFDSKWQEIIKVLKNAPSSRKMLNYIKNIGLDIKDFYKLYGKKNIKDAVYFGKDLKDRFSVLWVNYFVNYKEN